MSWLIPETGYFENKTSQEVADGVSGCDMPHK